MSVWLEITLHFQLVSGLHITGERMELWTDKSLVLDWREEKHPVIPATTLKGWLRDGAERTLRGLGVDTCDSSRATTICGVCPACEVFGSPWQRSPLRFFDAELTNIPRDVRMSVSLSRHRKTAYEERLFSLEVAWGSIWAAKVQGLFPKSDKAEQAAALLWASARMGYAIGAARSRGLGWLCLKEFRATVDGKPCEDVALAETLKALTSNPKGGAL